MEYALLQINLLLISLDPDKPAAYYLLTSALCLLVADKYVLITDLFISQ